jgi:hypothetical protein
MKNDLTQFGFSFESMHTSKSVTRALRALAIAALALILFESCTTVPVTGRRELNVVSSGDEMQLGLTSFDSRSTRIRS